MDFGSKKCVMFRAKVEDVSFNWGCCFEPCTLFIIYVGSLLLVLAPLAVIPNYVLETLAMS